MKTNHILESDWSDFEQHKSSDNLDHRFISCEEEWEVEYLVKKIAEQYRGLQEGNIRRAIAISFVTMDEPHYRGDFVQNVIRQLIS